MNPEIKNILDEEIQKILDEDYPTSFDMEYFKSLTSFQKRIQYCNEHLQRLSSGSSRIVYKIDEEKVLKLARNRKGLVQNEKEISDSQDYLLKDIVANVYDYEKNALWLEMELARKLTPQLFKQIVGVEFDVFVDFITTHYSIINSNTNLTLTKKYGEEFNEFMWENEFVYSILDYVGSYNVLIGDLGKIDTYGVVKRNGVDTIVVVDFGLDEKSFKKHYMKQR